MLEDLKDTMNKRAAILNQMRYTEPDIESKKKENDIGALQLSVPTTTECCEDFFGTVLGCSWTLWCILARRRVEGVAL